MLLSLFALSLTAFADDVESLTYQLTADGQIVGERSLTIRYLQGDTGEVRLLESYTDLSVPMGRGRFEFRQRLGGIGRAAGGNFTSTIDQTGGPREVQAVHRDEGWQVTVVEPGHTATDSLVNGALDATSLSLVDPGARGFLDGRTRLRVLTAETGAVLSGSLISSGEVELSLGGQSVPGESWLWRTEAGDVELVYGEGGHLLRYTMQVAGLTVRAELTEAPASRDFGEALELGTLLSGGIGEESL